jgi:D-xylose transport system permease protein
MIATAHGESLGDYVRQRWIALRSGELGTLPIVIGLLIIVIFFQSQNDRFLTAGNFVNLIVQAAAITTIAMGLVFVLLLGEIDLSVGYVSGVTGAIAALLLVPDGTPVPALLAFGLAVGAGAAIGAAQGLIVTKVGLPSFVVTLAGLLGWHGVVLVMIGSRGTITVQNTAAISITNGFFADAVAWLLLLVCLAGYAVVLVSRRRARIRAGLTPEPNALFWARIVTTIAIGAAVVQVANSDRGIPYVLFALAILYVFWSYILTRTQFGRWVYAIGGSIEAARRAGINTDRVRIACFSICSAMAAFGGIILASRLRSVDTAAGGGPLLLYSIAAAVIGGTSLFGGRGHVKAAVLGALVIAAIDNGLGLLGLKSGQKFIITGVVLLLAVSVDALARRGRARRTGSFL